MFKTFLQSLIIVFVFFGNSYSQTISQDQTIMIDLGSDVTLEMVKIPAGRFCMGSPSNDYDRLECEGPTHEVTISKDFYLGKYEVTQKQWAAIMRNNNPSKYAVGGSYPVEMVSWSDCQKFIAAINAKYFKYRAFRLPTEAEWEYACRANTTTRYYWGDKLVDDKYGWYEDFWTHPVGQRLPNAFNLYDMSGNVWEWCNDWYGNYDNSPCIDPKGAKTGQFRIMRGAGGEVYTAELRSAQRGYCEPTRRDYTIGFRLALSQDD